MATLNTNGYATLLDIAKRLDPNGKAARIAEVLTIDSPLLQDMPWVEANGADGHLITQRSALPSLTWRKYSNPTVIRALARIGRSLANDTISGTEKAPPSGERLSDAALLYGPHTSPSKTKEQ